ncbi:hypothetical protein V1515DRAFT_583253, partial [Lipomyces mesembrius]
PHPEVAEQIALPACTWTAFGTHTARGYTTVAAENTSIEGMKADCDNINLSRKLAADFRIDVFWLGVEGFFYKCQRVLPEPTCTGSPSALQTKPGST